MKRVASIVLVVAISIASPVWARSLEEELRAATQSMLDAVALGERGVWDAQLHAGFIHMDENGTIRARDELLAELTPLPAGLVGRIEIDTFRLVQDGDVAVAAYEIQEYLDFHGQPIRSRFRSVDTWRRTPAGWRLLAQHTATVLKDPPAIRLTRSQLCQYAGVYALTAEIQMTVECTDEGLRATRSGRDPVLFLPEVEDVFFAPGQSRTRRIFLRNANGEIEGFADRREGEDVRWRRVRA